MGCIVVVGSVGVKQKVDVMGRVAVGEGVDVAARVDIMEGWTSQGKLMS